MQVQVAAASCAAAAPTLLVVLQVWLLHQAHERCHS